MKGGKMFSYLSKKQAWVSFSLFILTAIALGEGTKGNMVFESTPCLYTGVPYGEGDMSPFLFFSKYRSLIPLVNYLDDLGYIHRIWENAHFFSVAVTNAPPDTSFANIVESNKIFRIKKIGAIDNCSLQVMTSLASPVQYLLLEGNPTILELKSIDRFKSRDPRIPGIMELGGVQKIYVPNPNVGLYQSSANGTVELYNRTQHGELNEPYLILFYNDKNRVTPWVLVMYLQHNPDVITINDENAPDCINQIDIRFNGDVAVGFFLPRGVYLDDYEAYWDSLSYWKQIADQYESHAFTIPYDMVTRVEKAQEQYEVTYIYSFDYLDNDWNIPFYPFATLPYPLTVIDSEYTDISIGNHIQSNIASLFGYWWYNEGDSCTFTIPRRVPDDSIAFAKNISIPIDSISEPLLDTIWAEYPQMIAHYTTSPLHNRYMAGIHYLANAFGNDSIVTDLETRWANSVIGATAPYDTSIFIPSQNCTLKYNYAGGCWMDHPYNTGYQVKHLVAFYDYMSGTNQAIAQSYIKDYYEHWKSIYNPLILWSHASLMSHPVGRTDFWAYINSAYFSSIWGYTHGNTALGEDAAYHYSSTLMNFRYELHALDYLKQVEGSRATEMVNAVINKHGVEPCPAPWVVYDRWGMDTLGPETKVLSTFIAVALRRKPEILTMREQANGEELTGFMQELYNKMRIIYPDTAFTERGFYDLMILYAFAGMDLPSFDVNMIGDPFKFMLSYSIYKLIREKPDMEEKQPSIFWLYQNCPNPFISSTSIRYSIAKSAQVKLKIYNVAGQLVKTLVNGEQKAGTYKIEWNGKDEKSRFMPSGIYFVKLKVGDFSQTKKLLILR